jgi:hypothetical protein
VQEYQEENLLSKVVEHSVATEINKKNKLRNEIFLFLYSKILKWINTFLNKTEQSLTEDEKTSLSWDCFLNGLEHFDAFGKHDIIKHFYVYSRYHIISIFGKKFEFEEKHVDMEVCLTDNKYKETVIKHERTSKTILHLFIDINNFKDSLPDDYKLVFEDALLSCDKNCRNKSKWKKTSPINYHKYCEAKKIYIQVINYFLKGN